MTDVADRAGQIGPVGNGPRRGRSETGKAAPAALVALALLLPSVPVQSATTEFVVPGGPLITLQDGRVIDGHIVGIDQTDVIVQTSDGATETLPRSTVANVAFETVTGRELVGELIGWASGVYQITTVEAAIKVYSTMPTATAAPAVVADTGDQGAEPVTAADAGQGSSQSIAAVAVEETTIGNTEGGNVDTQSAAATPTSDLSIQVSVENSRENGPPVAFNIELSAPSENSVVLIYATIDGTAINGEDYEANRGVVVIKPGERAARIEAPIIDDDESEDQEHLQLFLTVDPTVAVVENRQIIATIDDDDED